MILRQEKLSRIRAGVVAGLAGTGAMMALRSFDMRYAPKTVPSMREDPGELAVRSVERAAGACCSLPAPLAKAAAIMVHTGYGTFFAILYALVRGRKPQPTSSSPLEGGILLGLAVYCTGYLGWLPALRFTKPVWKQEFPEIAGEAFRHVAYGIVTVWTYRLARRLL
jgi:hypothetical protein